MSDEDPLVDNVPLSKLRVVDLRDELKKLGLPNHGNKSALQERLKSHLVGREHESPVTSPSKAPSELGSPPSTPATNPIVAQYRARQQAMLNEAKLADPRRNTVEEDEHGSPSNKDNVSESSKNEKSESSGSYSGDDTMDIAEKPIEENIVAMKKEKAQPVEEEEEVEKMDAEDEKKSEGGDEKESEEQEKREGSEEKNGSDSGDQSEQEGEEETKTTEKSEDVKLEGEKVKSDEPAATGDDEDELDYGEEHEDEKNKDENAEVVEEDEGADAEPVKNGKKERADDDGAATRDGKTRAREAPRARVSSPSSRHPVSEVLHIRGLTRPFTEGMLRNEITSHGGAIVDFWMDKVKSHCLVKFESPEKAALVLKAMNGIKWPESNPKQLAIVHDTVENLTAHKEGKTEAVKPAQRTIGSHRIERLASASSTSEGLLSRTGLKVTIESAVRENSRRDVELKEKGESALSRRITISRDSEDHDSSRARDRNRDRDTKETERKRQRSETPPFSRGARLADDKKKKYEDDDDRRDRHSYRDRERERHVEEEVPLKTPDELFRKTTTTPAIYYLPLTEDEVIAKLKKQTVEKESRKEVEKKRVDEGRDRDRR